MFCINVLAQLGSNSIKVLLFIDSRSSSEHIIRLPSEFQLVSDVFSNMIKLRN